MLGRRLVAPGLGLLFIVVVAVLSAILTGGEPRALFIIAAAAVGGYMALNIGANDVANNVGPAVENHEPLYSGNAKHYRDIAELDLKVFRS